jgi:hypothetical protein
MIVIILIGAVYMLFISGLDKKKTAKPLRFEELRGTILKLTAYAPATLSCSGDACENCVIRPKDGGKEQEIALFHTKPKVFGYDRYGYLQEKRFPDKTCFEYTIHNNLSGENILVEREGVYYLFYAYLKKATLFTDYDKAVLAFDPAQHILLDTQEYYYARQ